MKNQIIIAALALLAYGSSSALACSSCGCTDQTPASHGHEEPAVDIIHTAEHAGQFKTLLTALRAADLVDALKIPGPFTVFAPTDKAFAALPAGTVESLLLPENKAKLQSILKYHVVAGNVMSTDILKHRNAKTLHGNKVKLTLLINGARVIEADIKSGNGVIHVIDRVILPDSFKPARGYANKRGTERVEKDIVQTAVATGKFKTLVAAVQAADLADALSGKGPFTVFAPTDKAFAKLPPGTVENLLLPENKAKLQAILKYHVLPASLSSHDIVRAHTVKTLSGRPIYPSVLLDSSAIKMKNIYCRNGVIHVIDSVMLPKEKAKT
jgi:transforming growth factor-beta-induced protein